MRLQPEIIGISQTCIMTLTFKGGPLNPFTTKLEKYLFPCGGRQGGLKLLPPVPFTPASRPRLKGFPPLCSIYIVKCYAILQNFSLFSRFPPPWESCFPPFPLPPPVPLLPPILPGSHPSVPLHSLTDCKKSIYFLKF